MISKIFIFVFGFLLGGLAIYSLGEYLGVTDSIKSSEERDFAIRIESIPIEKICEAIGSGKQILGDDLVTVWTDGKRYLVMGWHVNKSGLPLFHWAGADLPTDIAGCNKRR